jgi:ribosomal protein L29
MVVKKTISPKRSLTKKVVEAKTIDQLREELISNTADLLQARRGNATGELTNPHLITVTRKKIARLNFAIHAAEQGNKEKM